MKSITPDKLVSMILEEINKSLAPDKPMYFNSLEDVARYYGFDKQQTPSHETEVAEMANIVKQFRKLADPLYIPINELSQETKSTLPKVRCLDPQTNQITEDVIIGDEVTELPNGVEMLRFQNYAEGVDPNANKETEDQRSNKGTYDRPKLAHYVVLPENIFFSHPPRNKKYNTAYVPHDLSIDPPNESPEDKETRITKLSKENEAYAKRYVIFPAINNVFGKKEILDRLDVALIPETWANIYRTERTTNKEVHLNFGGNGTDINAEFYAIRDFDDKKSVDENGNPIVISGLENALNDIIKTRMDIEDGVENRERKMSETKPREYANYIYTKGGNWPEIQRIYDEAQFKNEGEYTKILKLLKQNILKGQKGMNVKSKLNITGILEESEYILRGKFDVSMNFRSVGTQTGKSAGDLIRPITVEVRRKLSDEQIADPKFSIRKNKNFFGKASGTEGGEKGIFVELMNQLGQKILTEVNPDEVLTKISELLVPANVDKEFLNQEF